MPEWRSIHESHAIDVMAAVLTFAEPVPSLPLRKMLRAAEDTAFAVGLKSRHSSQAMQFTMTPHGAPVIQQQENVQGMLFNALFENPDGTPIVGRIAKQLQVTANAIIYRTWRYVSWAWQRDRILSLISPAFSVARDLVSVATVRLEYLDRFWFDGEIAEADASKLLRKDSRYLAPHIFGRKELWHVHTGAFLTPEPQRRLEQIQVDALDARAAGVIPTPEGDGPVKRWVHITTALEDQFPIQLLDDPRQNADFPYDVFDAMHSDLKILLGSIITETAANHIYLNADRST